MLAYKNQFRSMVLKLPDSGLDPVEGYGAVYEPRHIRRSENQQWWTNVRSQVNRIVALGHF